MYSNYSRAYHTLGRGVYKFRVLIQWNNLSLVRGVNTKASHTVRSV